MRVLGALPLLVLLLASGCLQGPSKVAGPEAPEPALSVQEPARPTTWFLHLAAAGAPAPIGGQPTCGVIEPYMDLQDTPEDCGDHGQRLGGSPLTESACNDLCFLARNVTAPAYAAATPVQVLLYLTVDAVEQADIWVWLLADDREVAAAELADVLVFGTGGATFQEIPIDLALTAPIPAGAQLEFQLRIRTLESYFVGFEGDSATRFTIA